MGELATLVGAFLALVLAGAPVALAMALATGLHAALFGLPSIVVVQTFMQGLDNTAFTAIPYFFLVGAIMNAGGMSARLLRLARALLAHFRGGLSHVNIGASVVFAGVSGSAVADAAAVGSVMIPAMRREGYAASYAAAVTAASATIGLVIPPSIPLVIFGLFTGADIGALFLAGIVPGLLMGAFLLVASAALARARGYPSAPWAGWGEVARALRASVLALLLPVIVVAGLTMGFATAAEIGAVAAVYAAAISALVYREATLRDLWRALGEAAADSAKVLIVVAISGAFVWIVAAGGAAGEVAAVLEASGLSGRALLGLVAALLVVLGTVLEPITLLVVVVPVLVPACVAGGVDLVQMGIVSVLAAAIGLVTPPVGILLFIASAQAEAPAGAVIREALPFLAALLALLAVIVAVPALTLSLPALVG